MVCRTRKIQKNFFSLKVVAGPLNQLECVSCKENFKGKGIHHYYKCKAKKIKLFIVENVSWMEYRLVYAYVLKWFSFNFQYKTKYTFLQTSSIFIQIIADLVLYL